MKSGSGLGVSRWALAIVVTSGLLAPGCAAPNRPDPGESFDEIAQRALNNDVAFVKQHVHPSLLAAETGPDKHVSEDEFCEQFASELQRYRALSWEKGDTDDKAVIQGAGINPILYPGTPWQFRMDMIYDRKNGWQISSRAYDRRAVGTPAETPEDGQ